MPLPLRSNLATGKTAIIVTTERVPTAAKFLLIHRGVMKRTFLFFILILASRLGYSQERQTFIPQATVAFDTQSVVKARFRANASGKSDTQYEPNRYLLISRRFLVIESAVRRKLADAAAAGYRVLAGVSMRFILLEKVARPPDTYGYLFVKNREEIKNAGAEGYRLVPLVRAWRGDKEADYEQVFLMEKPPSPAGIWSYSTVPLSPASRSVRMTQGEAYFYGHIRDVFVIYETPGKVRPILQHDLAQASATSGELTSQYRYLPADTLADLDERLRVTAREGYRVVAASDGSIELLAHRGIEAEKRFEYLIVAGRRASTMQRKLSEAGRRGFRLIPAAIGTYMKPYFIDMGTETYAVMEKFTTGDTRFEYRLVSGQGQLNKASLQGFEAVAMKEFEFHDGIVFMERPLRD
jgi:hypothetical protein